MKFDLAREKLFEELQLLQGIVEKRNTMPILANILMNVSEHEVELTGTDLEVGLRSHFQAEIGDPGAITVNGKKIYEIVKALPDGQTVSLEKKEEALEIRSGASEFKILCLPKDDYPQVPEPKFEKNIVLPLGDVKSMIDRVYYAITQEQRYYLNGALLSLKDRFIELVSTDGHRLSYVGKSVDDLKVEKEISVIVAKKTLSELRKFDEDALEFDLDENNLFFKVGNRTMLSRIIESKFPNFEGRHPERKSQYPVRREGGTCQRHSPGFAPVRRAVQGHQVFRREKRDSALLLEPRNRRGQGQNGRGLSGKSH